MQLQIHTSISAIPEADWSGWFGNDYPFLTWRFLKGLEDTGCTTRETGWQPAHLVLSDAGCAIAVAPAFLKDHSYGEYVFDWSWADAWQRAGKHYYPKLVTAAPFTPATGPRVWLHPERADALPALQSAVAQWCRESGVSGWHLLFTEPDLGEALTACGLHQRLTTQFHWFNRGYRDFDDFLDTFSSRKRKNLRKERERVQQQGLCLDTLTGAAITAEHWQFFHRCYRMTYAKRSGHGGYLTRSFFTELCPTLEDHCVMVLARREDEPVAAALYFRGRDTLYGRYWGCLAEYECLHFEACYYRGIEYCIAEGLSRFDPGAQGEHKIQRGFEPILTRSQHWLAASEFDAAVAQFTARESEHVCQYRDEAATLLPFKASA